MLTRKSLATAALAAALGAGYAGTAQAQSTTFAQFQQNVGGSPFVFTNNPAPTNSTFFTSPSNGKATAIAVNFQYDVANGYGGANSNIAATLTLTSWTNGPDQSAGTFIDQPLRNVTITINANQPVNGKTNLLTIMNVSGGDLQSGDIFGKNQSSAATLLADTTTGDNVVFTSDFLNFSNPAAYNYAVSLSGLNPNFSKNPDGTVNSFTAAGSGTFASTPGPSPVPAPSTLTAFSGGAWCLLLTMVVRARRTRRQTAAV